MWKIQSQELWELKPLGGSTIMLLKHGKSLAMCPQDCDKDWRWVISETDRGMKKTKPTKVAKLTATIYSFGPIWKTYRPLSSASAAAASASATAAVGSGGFLLAIWFNKVPERTVVWSANRDSLVQTGSRVQLTTDGEFMLNDPKGKQMWKADLNSTGVAYAAMLDTGNFVLAGHNSTYLWQSFNHPTDTILPTQILNQGSKLVARFSEVNYSSGRFMLILQTDGNLVLYTTDFPMDSANSAYWATATVGIGFQVIYNESGDIYLIGNNRRKLSDVLSNKEPTGEFYQRAILEYDGVFRQYVHPKSAGSGPPMAWSPLSAFIPENICTNITASTGSGACGFNSYCTLGDHQRPICKCPPGYTFLDPHNEVKGCRQDFYPEICDEGSHETGRFDFERMTNVDWPTSDYDRFQLFTEDDCRKACLEDCFCAVAIFRDGDCWKKKIPLSNGRFDSTNDRIALIKVEKNSSSFPHGGEGFKDKHESILILAGSVLLGSSVLLNVLLLLATATFILRLYCRKPAIIESQQVMVGRNLQSFTYHELEEATNGFKDELGKGAFGTVYKGSCNGNLVAVKKLERMVKEGEREFETEVSAIVRTNHKNLVQLLGFCNEGLHRLLVYEFMSNGSLATFLFGSSRPKWHQRIQIILGTAKGLLYLHEECSIQTIHCDIKPQNILLDDSLTARISDFGLAKFLKTDQTRTMTGIRGTKGYVAPEWFKTVPITVKVDVYSFGIVLLELIFCRKNFEAEAEDKSPVVLAELAYYCYKEGKLDMLLDNDEEALEDMERLEKFVMIAFWCIQDDPHQRPGMKKVTQMLEGAIEVSSPPDSSSFTLSV
ncbi:G-type lectin S-receptor-like serine/threonine-protein kinase LECRK3 [Vitis vinifera]|uniref:Receptor-like serine/threonine-protein kinase n=1 Tax=Vitis vinifera TaxID=29760 RepID=A0A438JV05_VITVI|nr:G-type lectin S-receptor-like serine/threonine-protein kinase LECRK3 [Vitis vinifera]